VLFESIFGGKLVNKNWYEKNLEEWKTTNEVNEKNSFELLLSKKVVLFNKQFSIPEGNTNAVLRLCIRNVADIDFVVTPVERSRMTQYSLSINGVKKADSISIQAKPKYYHDKIEIYLEAIVEHIYLYEPSVVKEMVDQNISLECIQFFRRSVDRYTSGIRTCIQTSETHPELYMKQVINESRSNYGRNFILNLNSVIVCLLDMSVEDRPILHILNVYDCTKISKELAIGFSVPKGIEAVEKIIEYNVALFWNDIRKDFLEPYRATSLDYIFKRALDNPVYCISEKSYFEYDESRLSLNEMADSMNRLHLSHLSIPSFNPVIEKIGRLSEVVLLNLNESNVEDPFVISRADSDLNSNEGYTAYFEFKRRYRLKVGEYDGDYHAMIKEYLYRSEKYMRDEYKDRDITHAQYKNYADACKYLEDILLNSNISTRDQFLSSIAIAAGRAADSNDLTDDCKVNIRELISYMV